MSEDNIINDSILLIIMARTKEPLGITVPLGTRDRVHALGGNCSEIATLAIAEFVSKSEKETRAAVTTTNDPGRSPPSEVPR